MTWRVIEGDGPGGLADLEVGSVGVVMTDPPWPNGGAELFACDPDLEFARLCHHLEVAARRLVVVLGCMSDVRLLRHVPPSLPFERVVWLRYAVPNYCGDRLNGADAAYLFGDFRPNPGRRVLPGEMTTTQAKDRSVRHPTPRRVEHMAWLIDHYTAPGSLVVDPFCGSGTTGVAALRMGRRFLGFDVNPTHVAESSERLALEASHSSGKAAAAGQKGLFE